MIDTVLDEGALGAISRLCRRAMGAAAPTRPDLGAALFGARPVTVRGDPDRGVVASAVRNGRGSIRLLAVDPAHQRQGLGRALLRAAEADLTGCPSIIVGADPPDYLFPGVDSRLTPMLCLLEEARYMRVGVNLNMDVDLRRLPPDPGDAILAGPGDAEEVRIWAETHWPHWTDEMLAGLHKGRLVVVRDEEGLAGVCAWDVTRAGWLGPMAVRPGLIGRGMGVPLVIGCLTRMRDAGRVRGQISWISPARFYSRTVGATMGTAWIEHRKDLPAGGAR